MEIDLTGLVLPDRIDVAERSEDGRRAQFVVTPLERGFGHTLGNSVRRILLSSLPGAAVWGFRMDGVLHEHQTVEDVVEDVHQIIQNLKSLVLSMDEDRDETVLELSVEKAGAVTAEAIDDPGPVTLIEPDHHLFTLQEDREVNLSLYINKGRGFVSSEQHEMPDDAPVDLVRIDSIYNPVLRANFTVEETRVGQRTDFDRLTLSVETNGSMEPEDAVAYGAELARRHLEYMLQFSEPVEIEPPVAGSVKVPQSQRDLLTRPIEELAELSVRSVNSLKKAEITTLSDLVERTGDEMLEIDNFGAKSLEEVREFLADHDLRLGMAFVEGDDEELYIIDQERLEAEQAAAAAGEAEAEEETEEQESAS